MMTARGRVARALSLAATPTFAIMALVTAVHRGSMPATEMTTMYSLMGVFHSGPWLRLLAPSVPR
jgi:hypothetical protein